MKSRGISPIYYHKTDDSRLELDFIIQYKGKLLPIEIKAEGNVRANSLTTLLKANPDLHAVRFSMPPYKKQEQLFVFLCMLYNCYCQLLLSGKQLSTLTLLCCSVFYCGIFQMGLAIYHTGLTILLVYWTAIIKCILQVIINLSSG